MASEMPAGQAVLRPPPIRRSSSLAAAVFTTDTTRMPLAAFDDVDHALVRALLADSKISNRGLALRVQISESAVSIRLCKLMSSGALLFSAVIAWERAGFEWCDLAGQNTPTFSGRRGQRRRRLAAMCLDGSGARCLT
jgi:hypothetical protein